MESRAENETDKAQVRWSYFEVAKKGGAVNTSCTFTPQHPDTRQIGSHGTTEYYAIFPNGLVLFATVAELVYAQDLGSCGVSPWEFESPRSHSHTSTPFLTRR